MCLRNWRGECDELSCERGGPLVLFKHKRAGGKLMHANCEANGYGDVSLLRELRLRLPLNTMSLEGGDPVNRCDD